MNVAHAGRYLRIMSTAAGHALDTMNGVSGHSASSFETCALTLSAPCAVSETPAKPTSFSAAASRPMETPLKKAAKLGATDA